MSVFACLFLALALDAALGEPRWLWSRVPHPAVLMGRAIATLDRTCNTGAARRAKGIAALAVLCAGAVVVGLVLGAPGGIVSALVVAVLVAQRSLMDHVGAVADGLRVSLGDGRRAVGQIVGRDTAQMGREDVSRAAIESAAENFSDGVIAPIFWFLVAGVPGIVLYKMVNTADSMIGHRTERYREFGWAAARLDDVLNWVPARLTALLIAALSGGMAAWAQIAADARRHRSPNAGWPEAALARALGVALAGPRSYDGVLRDYPYVHPHGARQVGPTEIDAATGLLWRIWGAVLALALVGALLG
ncbi:adenosylcobinamide-phosphate synthase CbiB [Roseovarius sp. ZX-A-9]|uniref:adenosylcobinamide-phosphate synthase CbiB n=1 Tax=Roseovarius sp. ZX-A-9 TaxID=3014783 RepID=UPI00232B3A5B|nr:adenosylcobinamide-phosphate synthase CbiB [Roseovarius sp. ZX-A-9]